MDDYDIRVQHIVERALTAKFSLWAALLTSHTVMLSVAVALLAAVKPVEAWFFRLTGFIAVICMLLVLLNLVLTKLQYELIGKRLADPEVELREATRARDLRQAVLRHRFSLIIEVVAVIGLATEALLFAWALAGQ